MFQLWFPAKGTLENWNPSRFCSVRNAGRGGSQPGREGLSTEDTSWPVPSRRESQGTRRGHVPPEPLSGGEAAVGRCPSYLFLPDGTTLKGAKPPPPPVGGRGPGRVISARGLCRGQTAAGEGRTPCKKALAWGVPRAAPGPHSEGREPDAWGGVSAGLCVRRTPTCKQSRGAALRNAGCGGLTRPLCRAWPDMSPPSGRKPSRIFSSSSCSHF